MSGVLTVTPNLMVQLDSQLISDSKDKLPLEPQKNRYTAKLAPLMAECHREASKISAINENIDSYMAFIDQVCI